MQLVTNFRFIPDNSNELYAEVAGFVKLVRNYGHMTNFSEKHWRDKPQLLSKFNLVLIVCIGFFSLCGVYSIHTNLRLSSPKLLDTEYEFIEKVRLKMVFDSLSRNL